MRFTKAELNKFSGPMQALLLREAKVRLLRLVFAALRGGCTFSEVKDAIRNALAAPDPPFLDL